MRQRGLREKWRKRCGGGGQVRRRKRQPSPRNGGYEKGAANVRRERVKHQAVAPGHSDRTDPGVERRQTVGTPHDAIGKNAARGRNPARCFAIDKTMRTYRYGSGDDGHGSREPRHSEGGRAGTGRRGGRVAAIRGAPTRAASGGGATAKGRRGRWCQADRREGGGAPSGSRTIGAAVTAGSAVSDRRQGWRPARGQHRCPGRRRRCPATVWRSS